MHDHDRGLAFDLATLLGHRRRDAVSRPSLDRRRALRLMSGAGLVALAGCTGDGAGALTGSAASSTSSSASSSATNTAGSGSSCSKLPEETAGPYPGDGSNGPNALSQSGIVRSDIRSSFGSASGVAAGRPLTVTLNVLNVSKSCAAYSGAAVYLWHCDRDGNYSMYSRGLTNENYLRGVQEAGSDGTVTFRTIYPGAYSGRWPHIHFEVYPNLAKATSSANKIATSQLAFPEDVCKTVYATDGYSTSVRNLSQTSLARDNVFGDGYASQLATVTGDVSSGFVAKLSVPV